MKINSKVLLLIAANCISVSAFATKDPLYLESKSVTGLVLGSPTDESSESSIAGVVLGSPTNESSIPAQEEVNDEHTITGPLIGSARSSNETDGVDTNTNSEQNDGTQQDKDSSDGESNSKDAGNEIVN